MAGSFIPKDREGLLLRDPLTFAFSPPSELRKCKPLYSKEFDQSRRLSLPDQDALHTGGYPRKLLYYTRNNPHPARVRHIHGLTNAPICYIEDNTDMRNLMSPPSGQDHSSSFSTPRSTRFSARGDLPPAVGVVPVTFAWRDELEKKTNKAINRALGQPPPSRAGRRENQYDDIDDSQVLSLLCQILQTESVPACQAWLKAAPDSEKTIVLNMIRMAAYGNMSSERPRPRTAESADFRYDWAPNKSRVSDSNSTEAAGYDDEFSFEQRKPDPDLGLYDSEEPAPFRLPENDTVIRTARQLSRLASRQGSRQSTANTVIKSIEREPPSHSRNAQLAMAESLARMNTDSMNKAHERHRSASLSGPIATRPLSKRPRSRSATLGPSLAGQVAVSRERLGTGASRHSVPKLQYTSHWSTQ